MNKIAVMNEARKKYQLVHETTHLEKTRVLFKKYKNEPLFIAGIMLYWAEGTRLPTKYRKYQLTLINSNPALLETYCNFLRRYFDGIETALRAGLFIYEDIEEQNAKLFWSNYLRIPLGQFIKTQILPSRSVLTTTKLPYGTCSVYLNGKDYCVTVQSWIDQMSATMRE